MPRVRRGFKARRRRNRILKEAKGFRGKRSSCHAVANEAVQHKWMHQYRARRVRKREFRALWIAEPQGSVRDRDLGSGGLPGHRQRRELSTPGSACADPSRLGRW
jgi:large subunit ribosomal protein L20